MDDLLGHLCRSKITGTYGFIYKIIHECGADRPTIIIHWETDNESRLDSEMYSFVESSLEILDKYVRNKDDFRRYLIILK